MLAHLFEDRGDRIGGAAAGPGGGFFGAQHLDVGGGARIGHEHFAGVGVASHQVGDGGGVFDSGREAHAFQTRAQRLQPGQRQHQLVAAFAFGQRVNLVNHHAFEAPKGAPGVLIGGQQGEAFGRGQQDMRRVGALATAARVRGVAGAVLNADRQAHLLDRAGEVALDVCRERLQRRDVERVHPLVIMLGQIDEGG